jgi:formylmethanofuran dehydrogenase subunit C
MGYFSSNDIPIYFGSDSVGWATMKLGKLYLGGSVIPTAYLHIASGSATAGTAPIKLIAGTNLTTPEAGTIEFDGNSLFLTTGSLRSTILTNTNPAGITGSFNVSGSVRLNGNAGVTIIGNTAMTGSLNITGSSTITNGALILSSSAGSAYVLRTAGDSIAMLDNYGLAGRAYLRIGINGININNSAGDPTISCPIGMNINAATTLYSSATSHIFYGGTNKQMSIGTAGIPTAKLHIAAGAAAATSAPIKLTAGTNMTTPEAGAIEFDGNNLFFTTGSTRSTILTSISPASITGNLVVTGSLLVSGSIRLNGNAGVNITGNTVITGSLLVSGSSLVAGITPIPLAGTIKDGVTSVLGSLNDWNSSFYQGDVLYSETAGATITFGQLCYRTQNETWELADATVANAAAAFNMLGICVKSSTSTNPTSILINGFVETATYATIVKSGEPLYMATTAGSMTKTAPTTVGNAVRLIGNTFWDSNTNSKIIIRFNPENSWIEL